MSAQGNALAIEEGTNVLSAQLTEKCRGLASVAARRFRQGHGGRAPTIERDDVTIVPDWEISWEALKGAGATVTQEDELRTCFFDQYFALQTAGEAGG